MENRPILISLLIAVLLLAIKVMPAICYDDSNGGAHQAINRAAIERFEKDWIGQNSKDVNLKNASFNGRKPFGIDWLPSDGAVNVPPKKEFTRSKTLKDWIINGGWSADEPEWTMALVHFYDPANSSEAWLTDQQFFVRFFASINSTMTNPETDAVKWTFDQLDMSQFYGNFEQEYSWPQAIQYFKEALADKDPLNENYGNAWRAVGEIMHMVADMTIPAHVRNDGHAPFDKDPYEHNTYGRDVVSLKDGSNYSKTIEYYRQDARKLMIAVASYTNRNFFSKDTIPGKYSMPNISKMSVDKNKYLKGKTEDGYELLTAAPYTWFDKFLGQKATYYVDYPIVKAQQKILIPTAVRAAAGILYAFLPRFEVTVEIPENALVDGKCRVTGRINSIKSFNWPESLKIANSAYVIVRSGNNQKKFEVPLYASQDLNSFTVGVDAENGDQIWVEYDLGGYIVNSEYVEVESSTPTPTPTPGGWDGGQCYTAGPLCENVRFERPLVIQTIIGTFNMCDLPASVRGTIDAIVYRGVGYWPRSQDEIHKLLQDYSPRLTSIETIQVGTLTGLFGESELTYSDDYTRLSSVGLGWVINGEGDFAVELRLDVEGDGWYGDYGDQECFLPQKNFLDTEGKAAKTEAQAIMRSIRVSEQEGFQGYPGYEQ